MALDFPNSPTLNQTFTAPNGTIWLWDGVKWTATTSTSPYTGQGNVGRNLLHNPLFNVAQRGVGPWTTTGYTADRWFIVVTTDTASISRVAMTDTDRAQIGDESARFMQSMTITGNAAAGASTYFAQAVEDVRRLSGKSVTISFWAKAAAGTPRVGISSDQIFGSGGSPSASVNGTGQAVTISTTWTRYSLPLMIPSASGTTLGTNGDDRTQFSWWFSSGATNNTRAGGIGVQSGTFSLWGVQLEIGSVATPLEKPDPRYDLANCQRFFCNSSIVDDYTQGTTSTSIYRSYKLPMTMRAWPTITLVGTWQYYSAGTPTTYTPAVGNLDADFFGVRGSGLTNANGLVSGNFTASADL